MLLRAGQTILCCVVLFVMHRVCTMRQENECMDLLLNIGVAQKTNCSSVSHKLKLIIFYIFYIFHSKDRVTGWKGSNGGGAGGAGPGITGLGVSVPFLGARPQLQLSSKSTESRHAATCVGGWVGVWVMCSKGERLKLQKKYQNCCRAERLFSKRMKARTA